MSHLPNDAVPVAECDWSHWTKSPKNQGCKLGVMIVAQSMNVHERSNIVSNAFKLETLQWLLSLDAYVGMPAVRGAVRSMRWERMTDTGFPPPPNKPECK